MDETENIAVKIGATIFLCAVALAPLPFGLVDPFFQSIWAILMAVALILGQFRQKAASSIPLNMVFFGGMSLLLVIYGSQSGNLTGSLWLPQIFGPSANMKWISFGNSLAESGNLILILLTVSLGFAYGGRGDFDERLIWVVALSSLGYALLGLIQAYWSPDYVLWAIRPSYKGYVIGPFVNRNTAADYFGLGSVIWCLIALRQQGRNPFEYSALDRRMLYLKWLATFLMLACVALSGSRAGAVFSLLSLVVSILLYTVLRARRQGVRLKIGKLVIVPTLCAVVVFGLFSADFTQRMAEHGLVDESRAAVFAASQQLLNRNFWFGMGPGSFSWLFPEIRPDGLSISNSWNHVHNSYLESAIELGVPIVATITLLTILAAGFLLFRLYQTETKGYLLPIVALTGFTTAMIHSVVDFPLFLPGYSVTIVAFFAVAIASTMKSRNKLKFLKKSKKSFIPMHEVVLKNEFN
jgi:O-antigen ligase